MRIVIVFVYSIILIVSTMSYAQQSSFKYVINFRYGSEALYGTFGENAKAIGEIKSLIVGNRQSIVQNQGCIRLVSIIPLVEKGNIAAINIASIRGAVIRQWLRDNYKWLADSDFAFYIQPDGNRNAIEVSYVNEALDDVHQSDLFFSLNRGHPEKVDYAVAQYKRVPFLDGSAMFEKRGIDFKIIDPALDPAQTAKIEGAVDEKVIVTIYYRWDKDNLDRTYLTNNQALNQIDSLLKLKSADYIDSLRIVAYASPEGPPDYNKRLSERRANTLKNYLLAEYPQFKKEQMTIEARGENWDGFRRMVETDPNLPMKEQVVSIVCNTTITDLQRQSQIARLDGGRLYKNYILPNYYRYLRTGASLFVVYNPGMPVDINFEPIEIVLTEPELVSTVDPDPELKPEAVIKYPIAFRTNLLYDAVGAVNLGIEVPAGKHFSFIVDGAYAYWRSLKNLYALQTLEYGTEFRYWSGVSPKRKGSNANWEKPLKGWYIGMYGRYWQRYDAQWIDGYQGDGTWSAGLTAGYAFPIGQQFSFEAGIGAGWLSTSAYRHYHKPEYDENGKYHLMWQETGTWSGWSLTKVRFALVWLIQTKKEKGRR